MNKFVVFVTKMLERSCRLVYGANASTFGRKRRSILLETPKRFVQNV